MSHTSDEHLTGKNHMNSVFPTYRHFCMTKLYIKYTKYTKISITHIKKYFDINKIHKFVQYNKNTVYNPDYVFLNELLN